MGVNFRCGDGFVPQHFLHRSEVCSAFHKMGGKGMTQGMRADIFADTCPLCKVFDDVEYHHARKLIAATVEEKNVFTSFFRLN